jgi:Ca2+-binding EF-hand superfamily protein
MGSFDEEAREMLSTPEAQEALRQLEATPEDELIQELANEMAILKRRDPLQFHRFLVMMDPGQRAQLLAAMQARTRKP